MAGNERCKTMNLSPAITCSIVPRDSTFRSSVLRNGISGNVLQIPQKFPNSHSLFGNLCRDRKEYLFCVFKVACTHKEIYSLCSYLQVLEDKFRRVCNNLQIVSLDFQLLIN